MIEVAIMIEGQNGLTWQRWQRIVNEVEILGFAGLYRSDHYTNAKPPDMESLELWVSLTWLASHTKRIEFGPLVTPMSFRHPTITARMASAVDDLSGGRLTLGLGAGWQEREHKKFGWDLLDLPERFKRFEEGLQVIKSLLRSGQPVNFDGEYYQLQDAMLLPRPQRQGGPPILIGGNGQKYTLPLAAKYASEWNAVYLPLDEFIELNQCLDELLAKEKRQPGDIRRSMMTGCVFGRNEVDLKDKVAVRTQGKRQAEELRQSGLVVGTVPEIVDQLGRLAEAGVQRVMLQWLDLDDIDGLQTMADQVLPQVQR